MVWSIMGMYIECCVQNKFIVICKKNDLKHLFQTTNIIKFCVLWFISKLS